MLFSINWLAVVMPLFLVQYILAIFTLTRLALARLPIRCYVVWNIVILLVFFVGSIVFLVYYYAHRKPIADQIIAEEDAKAAAAKTNETSETVVEDKASAHGETGQPTDEQVPTDDTETKSDR